MPYIPVTAVQSGGGGGNFTLIQDSPAGSPVANFDFTSIAGSYKHLALFLTLRGDSTGVSHQVIPQVTFNADTTSGHYNWNFLFAGIGVGAGTSGGASTAFIEAGLAPSADSVAGAALQAFVSIPNYAGTALWKSLFANSWCPDSDGSSNYYTINAAGSWKVTSAITRITVTPATGNWDTGSRATLYGVS